MVIIHELTMELDRRGIPPVVHAVQGDSGTRAIAVSLRAGGSPFEPPEGAAASVAFRKPDGKKGWYDTLPDGTAACTVAGSTVTAVLAPEVLTAAGQVDVVLVLQDESLHQLATFGFAVQVAKNPAAGTGISNDYYSYTTMEAVNTALDGFFAQAEQNRNAFEERVEADHAAFLKTAAGALDAVRGAAGADAPAIVCREAGSVVSVKDAGNRVVQGLTLYGRTDQAATTGRNLFDPAIFTNNGFTETNGVYYGNTYGLLNRELRAAFKENTQYTLQFTSKAPDADGNNVYLYVYAQYTDGTKQTIRNVKNIEEYHTSVTTAAGKTLALLQFSYGKAADAYFSNVQLEEGAAATAFEPYTGGIASPNPDYPQELVNAGAGGSIGVSVTGRNLFGGGALADRLVELAGATKDEAAGTVKFTGNGIQYQDIFDSFKANTQYTFILCGTLNGSSTATNMRVWYTDGSNDALTYSVTDTNHFCIFTSDANKTVERLAGRNMSGNVSISFCYDQCGIFEGALTEADFVPYAGQTITAQTPNGLPGIAVSTGGNYIDGAGQQWVCDEIDFARGVYVQRIVTEVLDGSEDWNKYASTNEHMSFRLKIGALGYGISNAIVCDKLQHNPSLANSNKLTGIRVLNSESYGCFHLFLRLPTEYTDGITDVSTFKEWLSEHPLTVQYALAEGVETPLTAEVLAQYAALHTNKPDTAVYNSAGVWMEAAYVADTKLYIDRKFNELAAAIVNNA